MQKTLQTAKTVQDYTKTAKTFKSTYTKVKRPQGRLQGSGAVEHYSRFTDTIQGVVTACFKVEMWL